MPVLNAILNAIISYMKSPKLCSLYFVAHTCICISFLPEEWKLCTKLTQLLLFHFFICTHSIIMLSEINQRQILYDITCRWNLKNTSLYWPTTHIENDEIEGKRKIGQPIVPTPSSASLLIRNQD